jgi:hypothetical protein
MHHSLEASEGPQPEIALYQHNELLFQVVDLCKHCEPCCKVMHPELILQGCEVCKPGAYHQHCECEHTPPTAVCKSLFSTLFFDMTAEEFFLSTS